MTHLSVDGQEILLGLKFWSNDLRVCAITQIASHSNDYPGGYTQTWHQTSHGSFDTVTPANPYLGRLVRFFEGKDAMNYPIGTDYNKIKRS